MNFQNSFFNIRQVGRIFLSVIMSVIINKLFSKRRLCLYENVVIGELFYKKGCMCMKERVKG